MAMYLTRIYINSFFRKLRNCHQKVTQKVWKFEFLVTIVICGRTTLCKFELDTWASRTHFSRDGHLSNSNLHRVVLPQTTKVCSLVTKKCQNVKTVEKWVKSDDVREFRVQDHSRRWVSLWPWHLSSNLFLSCLTRILNHVLRALMPIRYSVDIFALSVKLVKFECRGEAGVRGKLHPQPRSLSNTDCHVSPLYRNPDRNLLWSQPDSSSSSSSNNRTAANRFLVRETIPPPPLYPNPDRTITLIVP